mgnify:CR=1 FL=1
MKALGKFLLIEKEPIIQKIGSSGLLQTEAELEAERYHNALVISKGILVPEDIEVGSRIAFNKVQGHDIILEGKTFRIVDFSDVALLL